jgi:ABC-type polysaccharide/polyol phosphate export permease
MFQDSSQSGWPAYLWRKLLPDFAFSLRSWRVWLHMGVQNIRHRYRRSSLGVLWLFINLAVYAGAVGVIYGKMFNQKVDDFLPYLLVGFNLWGMVLASFVDGGTAFISAEGYIKQINFPKQVYLLRNLVVVVFTSLVGFVVFFLVAPLFHVVLGLGMLWALPGLGIMIVCMLGHIWIMAYLCVRFRDLPHAVASLLQIMYFLVPVLYPEKLLADHGLDYVYKYNPLYWLITLVRYPLLHNSMPSIGLYWMALSYAVGLWVVSLCLGARMDRKVVYWL